MAPGQYDPDHNKVKEKAAGWRIGTELRPDMAKKGHEKYPGAGEYRIPTRVGDGPKVHMHAKTNLVDQNVKKGVPGPGNYELQNTQNLQHLNQPSFTVGTG